jgi:hypothetical protein
MGRKKNNSVVKAPVVESPYAVEATATNEEPMSATVVANAPIVVDDDLERRLTLARQETAIANVMRHHLGNTAAMNIVLGKVLDALRNA